MSLCVWCSVDQGMLEEATVNVCKNFVVNNGRTGNLASLIRVFLIRADELKVSVQCHKCVCWQAVLAKCLVVLHITM